MVVDLFGLVGENEDDEHYQKVETSNGFRYYDFLFTLIETSIEIGRPLFSQSLIKAINFHAIAALHHEAGEYRSHGVVVGDYQPPPHYRVEPLMDDFVNLVNLNWNDSNHLQLAAYALWRITNIHPFVNGNGRTARAICYYIICVKNQTVLSGKTILPELLKVLDVRQRYYDALRRGDYGDLTPLTNLISELLREQVSSR